MISRDEPYPLTSGCPELTLICFSAGRPKIYKGKGLRNRCRRSRGLSSAQPRDRSLDRNRPTSETPRPGLGTAAMTTWSPRRGQPSITNCIGRVEHEPLPEKNTFRKISLVNVVLRSISYFNHVESWLGVRGDRRVAIGPRTRINSDYLTKSDLF